MSGALEGMASSILENAPDLDAKGGYQSGSVTGLPAAESGPDRVASGTVYADVGPDELQNPYPDSELCMHYCRIIFLLVACLEAQTLHVALRMVRASKVSGCPTLTLEAKIL